MLHAIHEHLQVLAVQFGSLQCDCPIAFLHGFLASVLDIGEDSFDGEIGGGVDGPHDLLDR